jgi:phosphoribosylanthranilate isomerase
VTIGKSCGIRTLEEGRSALRSGANWLGFVFWAPSKRSVAPEEAARIIRALRAEQGVVEVERDATQPGCGSGRAGERESGEGTTPHPDPLPLRGEGDLHRWAAVGVFVDPAPEDVAAIAAQCELDFVQLSGDEDANFVRQMPLPTVKAIRVERGREHEAAAIVRENGLGAHLYLLDTHRDGMYGGTGAQFDWGALRAIGPACIVAGGLRPDNVRTALETLTPHGVDVSGGVEFPGGGKDPRLIQAFMEAVRSYDLAGAR